MNNIMNNIITMGWFEIGGGDSIWIGTDEDKQEEDSKADEE